MDGWMDGDPSVIGEHARRVGPFRRDHEMPPIQRRVDMIPVRASAKSCKRARKWPQRDGATE